MFNKALKLGMAAAFALLLTANGDAIGRSAEDVVLVDALPVEARTVLSMIKRGGPYVYERDGAVFGNYERKLPLQSRGYYHEYTVPTPGARTRGARRIIVGGAPPSHADYFYTGDHYASFQRIKDH